MSKESTSRKLGSMRRLKEPERALVHRLLQREAGDNSALLSRLGSLEVQEMPDSGNGESVFSVAWLSVFVIAGRG
jgi:hypothetical protein